MKEKAEKLEAGARTPLPLIPPRPLISLLPPCRLLVFSPSALSPLGPQCYGLCLPCASLRVLSMLSCSALLRALLPLAWLVQGSDACSRSDSSGEKVLISGSGPKPYELQKDSSGPQVAFLAHALLSVCEKSCVDLPKRARCCVHRARLMRCPG
eukprot:1837386-Rhodomonas_salina.1